MMATKRSRITIDDNDDANNDITPIIKKMAVVEKLQALLEPVEVLDATVEQWIDGNHPRRGFNQSLPGRLDAVGVSSLKFMVPEFNSFGPCWSYSTRTKAKGVVTTELKLVEGGENNDAPR
jgi:hypothetical protein